TFITILVVVPVIGACLGGTIAYLYNWRAPFYCIAVAGLLLSVLVKIYLKDVKLEPIQSRFDPIGWVFYAVGIFCLAFTFSAAQQLDWYRSDLLVASFLIGLVAFGYYLLRSFTLETSVMNLRMFAKPIFSLVLLCFS